MKTLEELLKEKDALPIGNIYKKKIYGKTYYYHQFFDNGRRFTFLLSNAERVKLAPEIARRKEIEAEINKLRKQHKKAKLCNSAYELTGQLMLGNTPVAKFDYGRLIDINEKLAPFIIKRTKSLEKFLELRLMDMDRNNARILKKKLRLNVDDPSKIPLYNYAQAIGDNYWFRPKQSKLKYKDIVFNNDKYFDMAINGVIPEEKLKDRITPEISVSGNTEKAWKLIGDQWYLYKKDDEKQIYSELFCAEFSKLMGLKTAEYQYADGLIRSKNFGDRDNFEPIAALEDNFDNYDAVFNALYRLDEGLAKEYLKYLMFDIVVCNLDRHNGNLGITRDRDNGRIISLAPNFDFNKALISGSYNISQSPRSDTLVALLVNFLNNNNDALRLFRSIALEDISKESIANAVKDLPCKPNNEFEIIEAVYARYQYLRNNL